MARSLVGGDGSEMNTPERCKCGDFSAVPVCPKCRAKKEQEDKTVKFLIGEIVRPVVEPVRMPHEAVIVWCE